MALNRPFKGGLLLKGAYTLSKAQNETDDDGWATLMYSHPLVLDKNFALAGYDRTHVFQMGFVYELPLPRTPRVSLGQIAKNWQINGIGSAYSGVPFQVAGANPTLNCPGLRKRDLRAHRRAGRPHANRNPRLRHGALVRQVELLPAHGPRRLRLQRPTASLIPRA